MSREGGVNEQRVPWGVLLLVLLIGLGLGRFLLPLLERRHEVTLITRPRRGQGHCSFAVSTQESFLGRPTVLIDGGLLVGCEEGRRPVPDSSLVFVSCECEPPP